MTAPTESSGALGRWGSRRFWLVVTMAVAGLVYTNTLSYGSAWDDSRFVFNSGATEGVSAIPGMFKTPLVRDVPVGRGAYRPITGASYALDWTLGGGQASFFHWTNVLLHVLVSGLVFVLLSRLGAPVGAAAAGALVFAVHPVHVEAVANIAGRSELLVGLFIAGAAALFAGPRSRMTSAGIVVLFGGALLSKEHGVTLPVLLIAVECLRPGATGSAVARLLARWRLWVAMGFAGAAYMAARRVVLGTFTTADVAPFIGGLPNMTRVTTAIANWLQYARLHVFPRDLVVDYGPAVILPSTPSDLAFWGGLLLGAGSFAAAGWAYRSHRLGTLGLVWFAIALLPSSNLLVPIAQWLAERFFYVPSIGFSMAIAAISAGAWSRLRGREARMLTFAAVVALSLLAARSWTRNQRWEDTPTVIATLISEHPEAFRSQWYLGSLMFEQGRLDEAFAALDSAMTLQPNAIELPIERASWLLRLDRAPEAETLLRSLPPARHADREAHLTRALLQQGRRAGADSVLVEALAVFPRNPGLAALADSLGLAR